MHSKLNFYKFQINANDDKKTKLQKYLRDRNQKLLEKCFNIKIEEPIVERNKVSQQFLEQNSEKLSTRASERESLRATTENISLLQTNSQEKVSQLTPNKLVKASEMSLRTKDVTKAISSTKNMQRSPSNQYPCANSNKKLFDSSRASSKYSCNSNTKPLKTKQSKRSESAKNWQSPFNCFITKGICSRVQRIRQQYSEFSYDLSRNELKFAGSYCAPMRPAPEAERQLLKNGQRKEYLMQRYQHSPFVKYHYPEATSWRIGWLQPKQ